MLHQVLERVPGMPPLPGIGALRSLVDELRKLDPATVADVDLLQEVMRAGLCAAPLMGRRVAISGSAQQSYRINEQGRPVLGIGDAVAEGMLFWGAHIVINSYTPSMDGDRLDYLRDRYPGRRCEYVQADMSTEEGVRRFVRRAHELLGGLDVLVLNAGTYNEPPIEELGMREIHETFGLNLFGPMLAVREYLKLVGPTISKGRIILTSSINAQLSETQHVVYDASKGALEAFVRSCSLDLAKKGYDIRINGVAPGLLITPLTYAAITDHPETRARLGAAIPLGLGRPEDLVMPYLLLAMAENNYMTGTVLDVSGGLRATQSTEIYFT